jgi:hypothetical protein
VPPLSEDFARADDEIRKRITESGEIELRASIWFHLSNYNKLFDDNR